MTRLMAMASTNTPMVLATKVTGRMISKKAMVLKLGLMALSMKDTTARAKSMDKEPTCGAMDPHMKETGLKTKYMEKVFINGLMAGSMKESG